MKKSLLILFICFSCLVNGQILNKSFKGNQITTDQFGYYYEISDTEIKKYTQNGEIYRTYSNNVLGVIANVDVSNPYKILVYFRDFTKVLILDNFLAPTSEVIDLTEIDLDATTLVCRSYNDGAWYYNALKFELIRKDQELQTTNTSANIANLLGKNIQPTYLLEYNNRIYLSDSINGILVFDIYGTYLKTIPLYGIEFFQVKDKFILYVNKEGLIETYNFMSFEKKQYQPLKFKNCRFVRIDKNLVYVVNQNNELIIDKIVN